MKKFGIFIVIVIIGLGAYFGIKQVMENKRIEEIKKGWYVEITYKEPIKVRDNYNTKGKEIGTVNKGEVYKVLEVNLDSKIYYWYKIEYKNTTGWIASKRKSPWVNDVNNPTDIATPEIKFKSDVYKVRSIDDINYKHLTIVEDTDKYTITHKVYHEVKPAEFIDQYWIVYTITDGAGKSSSKTQKIEFDINPSEDEVLDFSEYKR